MTTHKFWPVFVVLALVLGCQNEGTVQAPANAGISSSAGIETFVKGGNPRTEVWADCNLYASVVTPATFKPESDPFDQLYTGGNGFLDGIGLIAESKPGDQDYNGGRWHLNVLKADVDPDKYLNVCSVEDLDLADFDSTEDYFECPLLPRRGGN